MLDAASVLRVDVGLVSAVRRINNAGTNRSLHFWRRFFFFFSGIRQEG